MYHLKGCSTDFTISELANGNNHDLQLLSNKG